MYFIVGVICIILLTVVVILLLHLLFGKAFFFNENQSIK